MIAWLTKRCFRKWLSKVGDYMFKTILYGMALFVSLVIVGCTESPPVASTYDPTVEPTVQSTPTIQPGQIFQNLPDQIDVQQRYVIYLHGRIIEDEGTRPVSPVYGVYEYEEILNTLAHAGLQVIAEVRPPNTDAEQHAIKVVGQINALLDAGVPAERITVIGFSKGGAIAIFTSSRLQNERVNFVLIAICGEWVFEWTGVDLSGRVLSIYETSDEYGGSCRPLAEASTGVSSFEEIALSTGRQHGAFYTADSVWSEPVIEWILTAP
jgi:hypothetical protein